MEPTVLPPSAVRHDPLPTGESEADRFDRAFERAAGAPLTENNSVRLLIDSRENFPAWLAAIEAAQHYILFESYIIADDDVGHEFIKALAAKAQQGVRVCVVYDWLGSTKFGGPWAPLRAAGAEVRCFNPPSVDSPLAWLTRDHRKSIVVDGEIAFVSGLCVSAKWNGDPARRLEPWRDTGVEIARRCGRRHRGGLPQVWTACGGEPLHFARPSKSRAGHVRVRVIAGVPSSAGTYRTDLLVASLAREHLWLTDAYFVGTAPYTQALARRRARRRRRALARARRERRAGGLAAVACRLSRAARSGRARVRMERHDAARQDRGRRPPLVARRLDQSQSRELDVELRARRRDRGRGHSRKPWRAQYEEDLARSTEIVLTSRNRVRPSGPRAAVEPEASGGARRAMSGSAGRAAAGAVSVGSALGAALTNRRTLGPAEVGLLSYVGIVDGVHRDPGRVVPTLARMAARGAVRLARCSVGVESVDALAQIEGEVEAAGADAAVAGSDPGRRAEQGSHSRQFAPVAPFQAVARFLRA